MRDSVRGGKSGSVPPERWQLSPGMGGNFQTERWQFCSGLCITANLLAFLFHTVLELFDPRYALIRKTLPRRDRFFHDIKALTQYFLFKSWDGLMCFMLDGLDLQDPGG